MRFATILDIGANIGQSAYTFRALFPDARIYSFEPLSDCHARMVAAMAGDARFQGFQLALGDESGMRTFHHHSFQESSSFLKMTDLHKRNFPFSAESRSCEVRMERLDDVAGQLDLQPDMLVKIDVQGFEDAVLRGGEKTIRQAKLLLLEVCFLELYQGQMMFSDIAKLLGGWGFEVGRFGTGVYDQTTGRLMWSNCTFIRA